MKTLIALFLMGTIDSIENDQARVELVDINYQIISKVVPLDAFPCFVKEGDMFYIEYGHTSARIVCGEPPD